MCSNFESIKDSRREWLKNHFKVDLPLTEWRSEIYPTYEAPFIFQEHGHIKCELAQFGLIPSWAKDKPKFGLKTYNARSETVSEKPSYRNVWKSKQFGILLNESFYEPCWETGKAIRWRIKRADNEPVGIACLWEKFVDQTTGEVVTSFSMLTINADEHPIMSRFHRPEDEKRSVVVLEDANYRDWLYATQNDARDLMKLAKDGLLVSDPAPITKIRMDNLF